MTKIIDNLSLVCTDIQSRFPERRLKSKLSRPFTPVGLMSFHQVLRNICVKVGNVIIALRPPPPWPTATWGDSPVGQILPVPGQAAQEAECSVLHFTTLLQN